MSRSRSDVRHAAAALFARGASRAEMARRLGVSRATATRWYRLWRAGGDEALVRLSARGRPAKLQRPAMEALAARLARSPADAGFALERWSLAAVASLIRRTSGVTYHPRHVARVLRRAGWVVPPVGKHAAHAMLELRRADPDGNALCFRCRPGAAGVAMPRARG